MKAPVRCLDCRKASMELDLNLDHQHLSCPNPECGVTWCVVCLGRISPRWLEQRRRMAKAALN